MRKIRLLSVAIFLILLCGPMARAAQTSTSPAETTATTNAEWAAGVWALHQSNLQPDLEKATPAINNALDAPVVGFSFRTKWSSIDENFDLLEKAKALADAKGKKFCVRFMAGRNSPARLFDADQCPYWTADNSRIPRPFLEDGSPNLVFEREWEKIVAKLAEWSRKNNIRLLHLAWYGHDWAELDHGAQVTALSGYSYEAFKNSHLRLVDIGLKYAGEDMAIEFPFSGWGYLNQLTSDFSNYIVEKIGPNNPIFFCQANGLSTKGDWGVIEFPKLGEKEAERDEATWSKPICRGEQMIGGGDYDWTKVFPKVVENKATYVEIYTPSFEDKQPNKAALITEIEKFNEYVKRKAPLPTQPTTAPAE